MKRKLRLRAEDAEDLGVIAAVLQDAVIPLHEMVYMAEDKRFMAAFGRYRRELQDDPLSCEGLTQIRSALTFEGIESVKVKGLGEDEADPRLTLLTIALEPGREHLVHINLIFAGDVVVQLRTGAIAARLEDFGRPWVPWETPCDHFADGEELPAFVDERDGAPTR